jgi:hypothetical protein
LFLGSAGFMHFFALGNTPGYRYGL